MPRTKSKGKGRKVIGRLHEYSTLALLPGNEGDLSFVNQLGRWSAKCGRDEHILEAMLAFADWIRTRFYREDGLATRSIDLDR